MNSKDRTASPGRKGLTPLPSRPNNPQETNNLVNNGLVANNRPASEFHPPPGSMVDIGGSNVAASENKTTLKIHLVDGGFNVVKCSDTTDIKVRSLARTVINVKYRKGEPFLMDIQFIILLPS